MAKTQPAPAADDPVPPRRTMHEITAELDMLCNDVDFQLIRANAAMQFLEKHGDEDLNGMVALVQPFLDQLTALNHQMRGSVMLAHNRAVVG